MIIAVYDTLMSAQNITSDKTAEQLERFGILLRILSGIAFTVMAGLIKYLADAVPLGQLVFFRSAFALIPLLTFLFWQHDFPSALRTKRIGGHLIRCILGTMAMFTSFATLHLLPVAEATTLSYLSPVVIVILATLILKEKVSARRWWGVALGLAGLLLMTLPSFSIEANSRTLLGIACGLLTAVLIAGALLQVRHLTITGEKTGTITFYFAVASTIIGGATYFWGWETPSLPQLALLISVGIVGGIAQLLMTLSFNYAEASALAPYEYLAILWAVIMGMLFFSEVPSIAFWLATPFILLGALVARPRKKNV